MNEVLKDFFYGVFIFGTIPAILIIVSEIITQLKNNRRFKNYVTNRDAKKRNAKRVR